MCVQAGHALVGALMPEYDPVQKISIVPRGQAGGLTFFAPSEERLESGLYSKSYLENQVYITFCVNICCLPCSLIAYHHSMVDTTISSSSIFCCGDFIFTASDQCVFSMP